MTATQAALEVVTNLAALALRLGRVNRVTLHEDGITPESDTDHTVMLALVAGAYAASYAPHLDVGLVVQYAVVHDLVEALCGDTNSLGLTPAGYAVKQARERVAVAELRGLLAGLPWVVAIIEAYEAAATPEARFVRVLDKVVPRLTHALNGAAALRALGVGPLQIAGMKADQRTAIASTYGADQPAAMALLDAAQAKLEEVYPAPANPRTRLLR